jgi:hypothetical protein
MIEADDVGEARVPDQLFGAVRAACMHELRGHFVRAGERDDHLGGLRLEGGMGGAEEGAAAFDRWEASQLKENMPIRSRWRGRSTMRRRRAAPKSW